MFTRRSQWAIISVALTLGAGIAPAQDYPNRPVRLLTTEAGGGADFGARLVAQALPPLLGQPVIVDNRAGALIAIEAVAKAPPDGYSLLFVGVSFFIDPLFRKTSYDPVRDFTPITIVATSPSILVVHPSLPVHAVKDLIALAKAHPGQLNYGASPTGSTTHLAAELFDSMAAVKMVRVTYKGTGLLLNSLLAGEIQVSFPSAGAVAPFMKTGRLRGLAVTGTQPSTLAPGLPTVASAGLPGFEVLAVYDMMAPAKTPPAIIDRVNQAVVKVLNMPEIRQRFLGSGVEAVGSTPEQLLATRRADMARFSKLIKDTGMGTQ